MLGAARRGHGGAQAAVVEFGAAALGLARRGASSDEGVEPESEVAAESEAPPPGSAEPLDGVSTADARQAAGLGRGDREVRAHEPAQARAGAAAAGSARLSYELGAEAARHAAGGSVPIDIPPVTGDPAATLRKMEIVTRAAAAPQSPSGDDRALAAQARSLAQQARARLAADRYAQAQALVPNG